MNIAGLTVILFKINYPSSYYYYYYYDPSNFPQSFFKLSVWLSFPYMQGLLRGMLQKFIPPNPMILALQSKVLDGTLTIDWYTLH